MIPARLVNFIHLAFFALLPIVSCLEISGWGAHVKAGEETFLTYLPADNKRTALVLHDGLNHKRWTLIDNAIYGEARFTIPGDVNSHANHYYELSQETDSGSWIYATSVNFTVRHALFSGRAVVSIPATECTDTSTSLTEQVPTETCTSTTSAISASISSSPKPTITSTRLVTVILTLSRATSLYTFLSSSRNSSRPTAIPSFSTTSITTSYIDTSSFSSTDGAKPSLSKSSVILSTSTIFYTATPKASSSTSISNTSPVPVTTPCVDNSSSSAVQATKSSTIETTVLITSTITSKLTTTPYLPPQSWSYGTGNTTTLSVTTPCSSSSFLTSAVVTSYPTPPINSTTTADATFTATSTSGAGETAAYVISALVAGLLFVIDTVGI